MNALKQLEQVRKIARMNAAVKAMARKVEAMKGNK